MAKAGAWSGGRLPCTLLHVGLLFCCWGWGQGWGRVGCGRQLPLALCLLFS